MKKLTLFFAILSSIFYAKAQSERMGAAASNTDHIKDAAVDVYNQGVDYSNNKQYLKGIECYKRAIAIDSNYIDAYNNLGLNFFETNALDSAAYYLHISLRKRPANIVALTNLGLVEEKLGDLQAAVGLFQQIQKLEPQNPEGYYNAASALIDLGRLQEGLESAKQAEKLYAEAHSPSLPDCHYLLLIAYFNLKDVENAKKYFNLCKKENVQINPQIVAALQ